VVVDPVVADQFTIRSWVRREWQVAPRNRSGGPAPDQQAKARAMEALLSAARWRGCAARLQRPLIDRIEASPLRASESLRKQRGVSASTQTPSLQSRSVRNRSPA